MSLLFLLSACGGNRVCVETVEAVDSGTTEADEVCEELVPRPAMALSETEVDFGEVPVGTVVMHTVDLRNDGDVALGVTDVWIGTEEEGGPFEIDEVGLRDADCAWEPEDSADYWLVLEPGCEVPITVSYHARAPGEAQDVLVVTSTPWPDDEPLDYAPDRVHGSRVTWLTGSALGEVPEGDTDPVVVGGIMAVEQTTVIEGETVELEVRVLDPDGDLISYQWSADEGTFDDASLSRVAYTAPQIEQAGGRNPVNLYAVVFDEDGHQDWVFGRITVVDATWPLYGDCADPDLAPEGGCAGAAGGSAAAAEAGGCTDPCADSCGGNSAFFLVLGVLGAARRRRPATSG